MNIEENITEHYDDIDRYTNEYVVGIQIDTNTATKTLTKRKKQIELTCNINV